MRAGCHAATGVDAVLTSARPDPRIGRRSSPMPAADGTEPPPKAWPTPPRRPTSTGGPGDSNVVESLQSSDDTLAGSPLCARRSNSDHAPAAKSRGGLRQGEVTGTVSGHELIFLVPVCAARSNSRSRVARSLPRAWGCARRSSSHKTSSGRDTGQVLWMRMQNAWSQISARAAAHATGCATACAATRAAA